MAPETMGTGGAPGAIEKPRPRARSTDCTPDAASSPKAEPPDSTTASTPPGQRQRIERFGVVRAGGAAAHIHRRRARRLCQDDGDARAHLCVFRLADGKPRHIRQQIALAWACHGRGR